MSTFTNEQKQENTKYPVTMSEFDLADLDRLGPTKPS